MIATRHSRGGDDSGIALITVLGVMLVITVLAVGAFTLSSQVLHESVRLENESEAFRAASSGLEQVLSSFSVAEAEAMISSGPIVDHTPDGTFTVTAEDLGGNQWRLTSVGVDSNGAMETVRQEFYFLDLWKMNFSGSAVSAQSSQSALSGHSSIVGPFYARGDLQVQQNMVLLEGPLFLKSGQLTVKNDNGNPNYYIGTEDSSLKVYADGPSPVVPNNKTGTNGGIYITGPGSSVPDIELPEITDDQIREYATKAVNQSMDNVMGDTERNNLEAGVTAGMADPATYTTMQPPNTGTWSRGRALVGGTGWYKVIAANDFVATGVQIGKGSLTTPFTIGGRSFGAWGSINTTDGISIAAGPIGSSGYPAGVTDDFAYDDVNNVLYVWGTVYVDGPLVVAEDVRYIGNGTIIVNGDITLNGSFKPYGTNAQGENNKWAVGLVTSGAINFDKKGGGTVPAGTKELLNIRNLQPDYAGAFFCEGAATVQGGNLVRGSILAGTVSIPTGGTNIALVTNPLLPTYLPQSLPGLGVGILTPGLWSRGE